MTPGTTVGVIGGGVVGERVRRVIGDRHQIVEPDVEPPIMVLATGEPHAPIAAELVAAGVACRVDGRLDRRRPGDARPRRRGPGRRRHARRRRGGLAGAHRAARPAPRRAAGRLRRAARRRARHGRAGVRQGAPPLAAGLGDRMARRPLDRAARGERSRAVLVPGAGRGTRLLPRRDARSVVAAPQLPRRRPHQRPHVRHPAGPLHRPPADAQPAAPRGRRRGACASRPAATTRPAPGRR